MKRYHNLWLVLAAGLLALLPLLLPLTEAEFSGSDGQAQQLITQVSPDYQPWFNPLWEPPSGEIESLLFALQAAIGAGVLGYYLGLRRGQRLARTTDARD